MRTAAQRRIRVAIIGVGNCASSLVQGVEFYRHNPTNEPIPGLMHRDLGGYDISDIEFSAAFDVARTKVGQDLAVAIGANPNNTKRFTEVRPSGVTVERGATLDGIGRYLKGTVEEAEGSPVDVARVLKETGTDLVVSYLPVGSQRATEWYAERALEAGCGFINCIPVFIASNENWQRRFAERKLPLMGDDVKSQVGATIVHRLLANLFRERGVRVDRTYQLNFGGNTDFMNMDWFDRQMEALADFAVTVTFCFTPEHRGLAQHYTSPPIANEEFAEFCAAMVLAFVRLARLRQPEISWRASGPSPIAIFAATTPRHLPTSWQAAPILP